MTAVLSSLQESIKTGLDFLKWFEYGLSVDMEPYVRKSDKVYAQTAYVTRCKVERCKIFIISDLPQKVVMNMGLLSKKSIGDAITTVNDGTRRPCYIIPDGTNVLITW